MMKNNIKTEIITYTYAGKVFQGFLAAPSEDQKLPGILIAHAWRGLDDFTRKKAIALAELGYVAFAADLYGNGTTAQTDKEAGELMRPLFLNRQELRETVNAGLDILRNNPLVDPNRLGAIGFCFGGLTVLELFRSGAPLTGAVCFHAVIGNQLGNALAKEEPVAAGIKGKILFLHGHDDPLVSAPDIAHLQTELTNLNVDWQMHIYGNTSHAFTNPEAHDHQTGLIYNACADKRSWQAMRNFFEEVFT
jgi:dienelactone hydrolase